MPKLTLSASPEVIDLAKQLASERGSSVSEMFSQIVKSMAEPRQPGEDAPKTRQATGLVRITKGTTDRHLIEQALVERFAR